MKKHILKLVVCTALSLSLFNSCDTDAEGTLYESDKIEYAFASTLQKIELLPSDGNKISVPVYRNTTAGISTVEISLGTVSENTEGLFSLVTPTVTFEDGKSTAEAIVSYKDLNLLGVTDVYRFSLNFDESKTSPSQLNSIEVSAQRRLTFNKTGTGTFSTSFFGNEDGTPSLMNIVVEKAEEANVYRLLDVYETGYPIIFSVDDNGNILSFGEQETGYVHPTYGMIFVSFVDAKRTGNTYDFTLQFLVPGVGSFGAFEESIQMPE